MYISGHPSGRESVVTRESVEIGAEIIETAMGVVLHIKKQDRRCAGHQAFCYFKQVGQRYAVLHPLHFNPAKVSVTGH